jgi:hypothetical protein
MAHRTKGASASSLPVKKQGPGGTSAAQSTSRIEKLLEAAEKRAEKAELRAEQDSATIASLTQEIAGLNKKLDILQAKQAEITDSNGQARELFIGASEERDQAKQREQILQMAGLLPVLQPTISSANDSAALYHGVATSWAAAMEEETEETAAMQVSDFAALDNQLASISATAAACPPPARSYATATAAPATPAKRRASLLGGTSDSDGEQGPGWIKVVSKAKKIPRYGPGMPAPPAAPRPARDAATAPPTAPAGPPKAAPLVILGLTDEQLSKSFTIYTILGVEKNAIVRSKTTKAGNIIIYPANEEASKKMLEATLPSNLKIKLLESSKKRLASPYIVIKGVPLAIEEAAITDACGLECRRLRSAANKGQPTFMVRLTVPAVEQKKNILENGLILGHQRFRAVAYNGNSDVLLCFKCYGVGHLAKVCTTADRRCKRCGEAHLAADCTAAAAKCLHCQQEHEAGHPSCPAIIAHKEERKAKTLTTAAKSRQPADNVEALRLAACIADCLRCFAAKTQLVIQQADINNFVARSVRGAFKAGLTGPHVKSLLLANAAPSDADNHE